MNTFANAIAEVGNLKSTENGAQAYSSTNSALYDMYAFGGAYRTRSKEDCILLFKNALEENETMAMKCLFYLRDIRGGVGERRFFRACFRWLCTEHPQIAKRNLIYIPEFARWDDLIYPCLDTPMEGEMLALIANQLVTKDLPSENPSLAAKWTPSENAAFPPTRAAAKKIREYLHFSHKEYRSMLSTLRRRINVVERSMSLNNWSEIDFAKLPSKAGLNYKDAFARREETRDRYKEFISSKNTKVNAGTLFPYEITRKAEVFCSYYASQDLNDPERIAVNKYWENQKDYFNGAECSILCVCDTSGSMTGLPMQVAASLSIYCAERIGGPFAGSYISFSSHPQIIKIEGVDFVDKYKRIRGTNLCENTNIEAVFDLLLSIAKKPSVKIEDIPKTIVIISDMEIDAMSNWTEDSSAAEMERIRDRWAAAGYQLPHLVYWNVNARNDTILDSGDKITFVSGCSPTIFQQIISGKTGMDLCLETLNSERYACIH